MFCLYPNSDADPVRGDCPHSSDDLWSAGLHLLLYARQTGPKTPEAARAVGARAGRHASQERFCVATGGRVPANGERPPTRPGRWQSQRPADRRRHRDARLSRQHQEIEVLGGYTNSQIVDAGPTKTEDASRHLADTVVIGLFAGLVQLRTGPGTSRTRLGVDRLSGHQRKTRPQFLPLPFYAGLDSLHLSQVCLWSGPANTTQDVRRSSKSTSCPSSGMASARRLSGSLSIHILTSLSSFVNWASPRRRAVFWESNCTSGRSGTGRTGSVGRCLLSVSSSWTKQTAC